MPATRSLDTAQRLFEDWLYAVQYRNYIFKVRQRSDSLYLQATFLERDALGGDPTLQHTRQWMLHPDMTNSELVTTALKLVLTSVEHEARENFKYRDRAIFGPHYNVDALHEVCHPQNMEHR